jgi:7,8-dihydroneopterin aldolase/epimerase/oxygenase
MSVLVELHGLELPGRHGALDRERETEQRFLYDVELELHEPAGDELVDTVDYREVVRVVRETSATHFELLESLAAAVADGLLARFPAISARVRVRKPDVELEAPVEFAAATVRRERS